MNLGVAMFIGNKLGKFHDMEMDALRCSWGAPLRMRVGVDVNLPLKQAYKIRTTNGEEHIVTFTYVHLPNLCYLCGHLGHIAKYCELRFHDDFVDPVVRPIPE
ncbi:hypothetical protein Salat_1140800 [Sesamum alatum]|uniref:CCHC-type domain-containing protein n=1 Tax=Sesamum alatum TaxID=300844 RepID=A0AAE1YE79_9LAMI|nr:hypothetical protein Salat_1140800 [Sesamum alatum]